MTSDCRAPRSLTVTAPNGGESWTLGSTQTVTWTSTALPSNTTLDISLTTADGAWAVIGQSVPNTGSFSWDTSQRSLEAGVEYTLNIEANQYDNVTDSSDAPFSFTE